MRTPEFVARIVSVKRENSSVNGNPRFSITFSNGITRKTSSDAGIAYGIENAEYRSDTVSVFTTKAGYIWDVRLND